MKLKILLSIICFSVVSTAKSQNWGGGIDDTDLHFGFTFQYISSEFKILKKADWRTVDVGGYELPSDVPANLSSISSKPTPGFGIGFVVNQKLNNYFDLRLTPVLVFDNRTLNYRFENDPNVSTTRPDVIARDVERKVQSTLVEFPLSLKLKSDRRNNFRAYMMGGVKYTKDISSQKKTNNDLQTDPMEKFLNNRRSFFSYEAGLGMDFYFEYFKMSPEIKLSYSMNSVLRNEKPHVYSEPLDKLMLRHVTFSLFFE